MDLNDLIIAWICGIDEGMQTTVLQGTRLRAPLAQPRALQYGLDAGCGGQQALGWSTTQRFSPTS